jgi:transposase
LELGKLIKFSNDSEGFQEFFAWAENLKNHHQKQKTTVGMEPTGHYWLTFDQHLKDNSIKIVLVNPFHVKRSKELDDNNPTKNDRKDPKTIAMLVIHGAIYSGRDI